MPTLVKIIGVFITTIGILSLIFPKNARSMMLFWRQGRNLYAAGAIRLLFGCLFLSSFRFARLPQVILTLGILLCFGGLFIFILGLEKVKAIVARVEKKPDPQIRLLSLSVLVFGALVVFSA